MKTGRFTPLHYSIIAVVLASAGSWCVLAQQPPQPTLTAPAQPLSAAQGALLSVVREATQRFKDVSIAEAEGYALAFGCVTGPDAGAMGLHFVNMPLVASTSSGENWTSKSARGSSKTSSATRQT